MTRPPRRTTAVPLPTDVLEAACAGDQVAFAQLYRAVQPGLRRYATVLVGQEADDVTGEAWLQIARDLRRFEGGPDDFRAWAARIVRNRAMDSLRHAARRPVAEVTDDVLVDAAGTSDTEAAVLEHLTTERAGRLIAELPRDQAEAVMLRAVIGLDARTAGEILGKSAAAIRVSTHRGLRRLATQLRAGRRGTGAVDPDERSEKPHFRG